MAYSKETWLKDDNIVTLSSNETHKDGYFDIMEERKGSLDIGFVTKFRKDVPVYKYNVNRTNEQICEHVLKSDRVKFTINKLKQEQNLSESELNKKAKDIMVEMGHHINLKGVRFFSFILIKIFKQLFRHVYVNEENVKQLHNLLTEFPVLLMPTHRSYFDFLLVSYVFYHYDYPMPAVAAAMDFKGMKFFGWLMQLCGAFYIRRSFGSDILYWAIFTEYVQTQLRNSDYPLQFFVEGTRSRTNKSYYPKTGMLSASLESYFKAELTDIMIIPVTVSYDRIVEENLYSYELLGIPKPKESTSGLLKARNILSKDFGSVHIHFSCPISIREFSKHRVDRISHSLKPRYMTNLNTDEIQLLAEFALHIVKTQQNHAVVTPWSLVATVIIQNIGNVNLQLEDVVDRVDWLIHQARHEGAYVDWPSNIKTIDLIKKCSSLRDNIAITDNHINVMMNSKGGDDIMSNAAIYLTVASYRNQLMHVFADLAIFSLVVRSFKHLPSINMETLFLKFKKLQEILSYDFIVETKNVKQTFYKSIISMRNNDIIYVESIIPDDEFNFYANMYVLNINLIKSNNQYVTFYCKMFEPFLLTYWLACLHLLSLFLNSSFDISPTKLKDLAHNIQSSILMILRSKSIIIAYDILSLDIITNALKSFINLGIITSVKRNQELWLTPNYNEINQMADFLESCIEVPSILNEILDQRSIKLCAKL